MDSTFDIINDNSKTHLGFGGDNRFEVFRMCSEGLLKGIPKMVSKKYPVSHTISPTNLQLDIYLTDINKSTNTTDIHNLTLKVNDVIRITIQHKIDDKEITDYFEHIINDTVSNHAQTLSESIIAFTDVFNNHRVKVKKKWLFF